MNYARAAALRQRALQDCHAARVELDAATAEALRAYQAHPVVVLGAAVGAGLLLSQLQVGRNFMGGVMRIAGGPAWKFARQFLDMASRGAA